MSSDVLLDREHLFLGSRLKHLAERMQADVVQVATEAGLGILPSQYSLLATLDAHGPQTIGALTQAMQLSQPAITRNVGKLVEAGLLAVDKRGRDQRQKTVALTPEGEAAIARSKVMVWPQVDAAVRSLTADLPGELFADLRTIEARLAETPLSQRAREAVRPALTIHEFSDTLAPHFHSINAQWINGMYRLEETDRIVLENPRREIVDRGGAILFVEAEGLGIVGTCALQKTGEAQYELTKMGVLEKARGLKAGKALMKATIQRARELGARRLYLLSNTKSATAIRLYEQSGFEHDAGIMAEFGARYARCDVAMLYTGPLAA